MHTIAYAFEPCMHTEILYSFYRRTVWIQYNDAADDTWTWPLITIKLAPQNERAKIERKRITEKQETTCYTFLRFTT